MAGLFLLQADPVSCAGEIRRCSGAFGDEDHPAHHRPLRYDPGPPQGTLTGMRLVSLEHLFWMLREGPGMSLSITNLSRKCRVGGTLKLCFLS